MADSGDSSPLSAAATDDAHHDTNGSDTGAAAQVVVPPPSLPVPPPPKVRLMVSYGGRIQPRPHDNQLSYVNGDTKILSIERPLRFPDFAARLSALAGSRGDICVKYQLPGEDLDALVTVTNDEDLEHLVLEYDRLHLFRASPGSGGGSSRGGGCTPRLRVFLFPVQYPPAPPPPQPAGFLEPRQDSAIEWLDDGFNSVKPPPPEQQQQQPKQEPVPLQSPPPAVHMAVPQPMMVAPQKDLDYLCGFDYGYAFVPPPAVKVKDPAGDPPTMRENVPVEIPPKNDERQPNPAGDNAMVSPADFPRQIQDLEKVQLTDNASQQPPPPSSAQAAPAAPAAPVAPVPVALPRNGSDDSLTRTYPPGTVAQTTPQDYYVSKFPEKPPVPPLSSAPPASAFLPVPGRFPSVAPGSGAEHGPFFFIPAPPHGYYATSANPGGTSFYAVAPHNGNSNGNGTAPAPAVSNAPAYPQVAYDGNGRAIYYTSVLPQYPSAVNGMSAAATVLGTEPAKPVAVKPTPTVS